MKSIAFVTTAVAAVAVALTGCTHSTATPNTTTTKVVTQTHTSTAPVTAVPAGYVAPLRPGEHPAKGEVEKSCPYIKSTQDEDPVHSVAVIEGNRVYRTTVITSTKPVGCRFYFWAAPYEAVADIITKTYGSATLAHNAMVATAKAGSRAEGVKNLVPGIDAVLFQTKFFSEDGGKDWACAFAKGSVLVIVHTNQTDVSFNARELAAYIAPKI